MIRIVCYGDSITKAGPVPDGMRWPVLLQNHLNEWNPGLYSVRSQGVGGNTSTQGLDRMLTDLLPFLPAVVLLEFGFNDASVPDHRRTNRVGIQEFRSNLKELIRVVKAGGGYPLLIANHPVIGRKGSKQANGKSYVQNYAPYQKMIYQVGKEAKTPVLDLPAGFKRAGLTAEDVCTEDGLHISTPGQAHYAKIVFEELTGYLKKQKKVKPEGVK